MSVHSVDSLNYMFKWIKQVTKGTPRTLENNENVLHVKTHKTVNSNKYFTKCKLYLNKAHLNIKHL